MNKILSKIDNLVSKIDYESVTITIVTKNDTLLIEKNKPKKDIGFVLGGRQ